MARSLGRKGKARVVAIPVVEVALHRVESTKLAGNIAVADDSSQCG